MCYLRSLGLLLGLLTASVVFAEPTTFDLPKGKVLVYKVVQTTRTDETTLDEKTGKPVQQEHLTKHTVVRKWTVTDRDPKGIATLEMTITSMRWEQKLADGETDVFDSSKPDDLNKNEMSKLIGTVQAIVRVDPQGKLIEVKKGNAGRYAADLPFKLLFPTEELKEGLSWERKFPIKLDPPIGVGESYEAVQKYHQEPSLKGYIVVGVETTIKEMPMQTADQIPLLPMLAEGTIYFNPKSGTYQGSRLNIKKELKNHAGEGTKYLYESTYAEDYQGDK